MHVGRHRVDAAADVEVGPFLQPAVQLAALLQHAVLHVDLGALVARKGHVQARQHAQLQPAEPFDLVEEIGAETPVAEEQPRLAPGAALLAVLHEGPEGGHAGAGTDHDDRRVRRRPAGGSSDSNARRPASSRPPRPARRSAPSTCPGDRDCGPGTATRQSADRPRRSSPGSCWRSNTAVRAACGAWARTRGAGCPGSRSRGPGPAGRGRGYRPSTSRWRRPGPCPASRPGRRWPPA